MCVRVQGSSLDTSGSELRKLRVGRNGEGRLGKVKVASGGGGRKAAGRTEEKESGGPVTKTITMSESPNHGIFP